MPNYEPTRFRSRLAWAITILEGLLWLAALLVFIRYWPMLPVKYRVAGICGLVISGAIGLFRIIWFCRKSRRLAKPSNSPPPRLPEQGHLR
ncbi:MAG TPA: hypothetical protein VEH27_19210 [Methylomirabilota bacterium]|nr:hypothetical protein [Methylomirabilota bacterium]